MTDQEREQAIQAAHERLAATGNKQELILITELARGRSTEQVEKMELERGLR